MKPHEKIRWWRLEAGYKQCYAAAKIGRSQQAYQKIEAGKTELKPDVAKKIAGVYDKPVEEVYSSGDNQQLGNGVQETEKELYEKLQQVLNILTALKEIILNGKKSKKK